MIDNKKYDNLEAIIDFAIDEERAAARLYNSTAEKTSSPELKALLLELADMERGHELRLVSYKKGRNVNMGGTPPQNLKLADYLVDVEVTENSPLQDILIFAIKSEKVAYELYSKLRENFSEEGDQELFEKLANEELKHKNQLEKIYDDEVYKEN